MLLQYKTVVVIWVSQVIVWRKDITDVAKAVAIWYQQDVVLWYQYKSLDKWCVKTKYT